MLAITKHNKIIRLTSGGEIDDDNCRGPSYKGEEGDIRKIGELEGDMREERKEWELAHLGPLSRSWDGFKTSAQGLLRCDSCLMKYATASIKI